MFTIESRVVVELVRGAVKVRGGPVPGSRPGSGATHPAGHARLVAHASFVTEVLYVELDFHPDTPITRLGLDPTYPELPTIPSDMDQLKSTLQQAVAELAKLHSRRCSRIAGAFKRANSLLELPEVTQALPPCRRRGGSRALAAQADGQVASLGTKLGEPLTRPASRWRWYAPRWLTPRSSCGMSMVR